MPSADTDLSLSLLSLCAGVFGDGGRQEYMSPPTPVAPHISGHPPGDIGYGMHPAQCVHVCACMCLYTCVYTSLRCMGFHVCMSVCSSLAFLLQHYFEESNQISSVCVNVITSNACLTEFSSLLPWLLSVKFESPTQPLESVLCMCRHC